MISVSENKIYPFLAQGICIYVVVGHSFLWNTVGPTPLICLSDKGQKDKKII
jgi:hypothetical protein